MLEQWYFETRPSDRQKTASRILQNISKYYDRPPVPLNSQLVIFDNIV